MIIASFFSGLVAVLLESSLLPVPFVLWITWWWSLKLDFGRLVWLVVICGLLLDILNVRTVGLSAFLLWLFCLGLLGLRQWFSEQTMIEKGYVMGMSLLWAYILGGVRGIWPFLGIFLVMISLMMVSRTSKWEIKLRS